MTDHSIRRHPGDVAAPAAARVTAAATANARVLGNGRWRSLVTSAGTGGAWLGGQALIASCDALDGNRGWFLYVRDLDDGAYVSLGLRPVPGTPERYTFSGDGASVAIERRDLGLDACLEIWVDPEHDAECRTVTLVNRGASRRRIELTSYLEVVLHDARAHAAHPAFSRLFVRTAAEGSEGPLLAHRRARTPGEAHPWLAHALVGGTACGFETDRARFLGRGRGPDRPLVLAAREPLSGTAGDVLDPILALRRVVEIAAGGTARFDLLLAAAPAREGVLATTARFADAAAFDASLRRARATVPAPARRMAAGAEAGAFASAASSAGDLDAVGRAARVPGADGAGNGESQPYAAEPLRCANGFGGFSARGDEYVIRIPRPVAGVPRLTPRPWINVLANPGFGALVSESGAGCTWSRNSREFRLTPWRNDPVCDPHDETLVVRDEADGRIWSPFPGPVAGDGPYEMRHGFGYSRCRHLGAGLEHETVVFVHATLPVKVVWVRITNPGTRRRSLAIAARQRLVLGDHPESAAGALGMWTDEAHGILMARRDAPGPYADAIAFAAAVAPAADVRLGGDQASFPGEPRPPDPLAAGATHNEAGAVPASFFHIQVALEIGPGETRACAFLLGEHPDPATIARNVRELRGADALDRALADVRARWQDLLGRVQVETPVEALDLMVNGWLPYQTMACRLWARTALYQSGGAFGFRDQLQDAASFLHVAPAVTRGQILLHAAHQFVEGDVLHWWHPPGGVGIRTRFADDLLWLPFVAAAYVRSTGDAAILDEPVRFLTARGLEPDEDEALLQPESSGETADLYEHCARALDRSLVTGPHGLPLFGSGDWNDGMNRVGRAGRGESVWMACFLIAVIDAFVPVCESRADAGRARRYRRHAKRLRAALEAAGWDGDWYRRGYFDDGTPLGSAAGEECRIDALVQAWAVISGAAPRERAERAMDAVERHLISPEDGLVRLLAPPFDRMDHDPGYIKSYLPGVRENGGQYTHAALWVAEAMARLGRRATAARLLEWISPVTRTRSAEAAALYQAEPYVVAADVCTGQARGRAGWTWYTGSSGWMTRIVLESLLGVTLERGTEMVVRAAIPPEWPGFRLSIRPWGRSARYELLVRNVSGGAVRVVRAALDGVDLAPEEGMARIPVLDDGRDHRVEVDLG